MPFRLAQAPRGLLELFKLRTDGHQPSEFSELVQPTVDVTDFYAADAMLTSIVNGGAGALPRSANAGRFGSPVRLHSIQAQLTIGAGALAGALYWYECQLTDANGNPAGLITGWVPAPLAAAFGAGAILQGGGQLSYPRVVMPGTFVSVTWYSNDPAATHTPILRFQFDNIINL